jgi:hypothetical protein
VFLVFDSGTCNAGIDVAGRAESFTGERIAGVNIGHFGNGTTLSNYTGDQDGNISLENIPLYDDMYLWASVPEDYPEYKVDIADFVVLQERLLGLHQFNTRQNIPADLNLDGVVNHRDLQLLRSILLGTVRNWPGGHQMRMIPNSSLELADSITIPGEKLTPSTFLGFADFTGFYRGQLAQTINELEGRSIINFFVESNESEIYKKQIITSEEDLSIKGMIIEIDIKDHTLIPEILLDNQSNFEMNYTNGKMVFLRSNSVLINSGDEILILPSGINPQEIQIELVLQNKSSKNTGKIIPRSDVISHLSEMFAISPNPAMDFIEINGYAIEQVELFDITGRLIKKVKFQEDSNSILVYLTDIDSGAYVIRILGKSGYTTKKLIVNK